MQGSRIKQRIYCTWCLKWTSVLSRCAQKSGTLHLSHKFSCQSIIEEHDTFVYCRTKVKQSRYRPGMAQRVPGSYGSQIT
jgi:hypothetical protein